VAGCCECYQDVTLTISNASHKICTEKKHFLYLNTPLPPNPENRSVHEIVWKNIVELTDDCIIRGMRFACWVPKATNTHSEYVILIAFAL